MITFKNIQFDNTGDTITSDILEAVSVLLCAPFPDDYKRFLIETNGGVPNKNIININGIPKEINHFFGITAQDRNNLIGGIIYKEDIPKRMIEIAHCDVVDIIALSLHNPDRGKVYFWDHKYESGIADENNIGFDNLTLIANSFDELLEKLYCEDDNGLE
jgi:hypothetical protein